MLAELLRQYRPVTATTPLDTWYSQLPPGATPRFWRSPSYLAYDSANLWATIGGCLCLLRRKVLHGRPVLYLHMPPQGPAKASASVLQAHLAAGIGCRATLGELAGVTGSWATAPKDVEYVYTSPTPGRAGRRQRNALARAGSQCNLVCEAASGPGPWARGCEGLADRWHLHSKRWRGGGHRGEAKLVRTFAARRTGVAHVVYDCGTGLVAGYSCTEQVGPSTVAIVARLRDYTWRGHPDPALLLHAADVRYWAGYHLTIGGGVGDKGLDQYKQRLAPAYTVPVYHVRGKVPVTLEEYKAACPAPS